MRFDIISTPPTFHTTPRLIADPAVEAAFASAAAASAEALRQMRWPFHELFFVMPPLFALLIWLMIEVALLPAVAAYTAMRALKRD